MQSNLEDDPDVVSLVQTLRLLFPQKSCIVTIDDPDLWDEPQRVITNRDPGTCLIMLTNAMLGIGEYDG